MDLQTQSLALSKDPETEGFDLQAGESWIYPTNYPTREYQYNIIEKALLKNTLVSLPTGLGKTFIAAVVMYNFYRWYPHGKVIFMAPTRPLVKQQIDACYNIMAIPQDVTAELTGTKVSSSRTNIWRDKRVFFVTPQVLQNDLEKVAELGPRIKCLVFDEAHRARGNHAYCQVIRQLLNNNHQYFRVLALSATPGSNVNDVLEVVHNLLISHLEFRTEESSDVQQYVFQRSLETVLVQLDSKLREIRDEYMQILEHYTKTLIKFKIVQGNYGSLTKGKIFMLMKEFQSKNRGTSSSNYSEIMRCLNICVTLYHAFELLIRHGLRNFLSFFDEHIEKPLLRGNMKLKSILENVRDYLGPIPHIEVLPDGTYPEIPKNIKFGHPKHYKLRDILVSHFSNEDKRNTRVIVFFEYRESVMEAHTLLLQSRPLIQPKIFLGQGSGITQKTQIGVVKAFKEGKCNTLLSTCIGEEGLDVGEVDLIVCFDISNKSPIRMVQRMGRTGRKRAGSVLVLVTEGKEQQTLKDCLIHKNNISTYVLGSAQLKNNLYPDNARMIPSNLVPRCEKMFITVTDTSKKNLFEKRSSSGSSEIIFSQTDAIMEFRDIIPETKMLSFTGDPIGESMETSIFKKHIENMRTAQKVYIVEHSKYTRVLSELLCYADSKRFNIPTTTQGDIENINRKPMKQGDIRSMFLKDSPSLPTDEAVDIASKTSSQDSRYSDNESTDLSLNEMFRILSNYLVSDLTNELVKCSFCQRGFCCEDFSVNNLNSNSTTQNLVPSEDIINNIALNDIENFITSLDGSYYSKVNKELKDPNTKHTQVVDADEPCNKTFGFEAPTSFLKLLESFSDIDAVTQEYTQAILSASKPKHMSDEELLKFFKLNSVTDIFLNSSMNSSQDTIIYSPEKLDIAFDAPNNSSESEEETQNILTTPVHTDKAQRQDLAFDNLERIIGNDSSLCPKRNPTTPDNVSNNNNNNMQSNSASNTKSIPAKNSTAIDDFCDLSFFGLTTQDIRNLDSQESVDRENNVSPIISQGKSSQARNKRESVKRNLLNSGSSSVCDTSKPLTSNESKISITQMINLLGEPSVCSGNDKSLTKQFNISETGGNYQTLNNGCSSRNILQDIDKPKQRSRCDTGDISAQKSFVFKECHTSKLGERSLQEVDISLFKGRKRTTGNSNRVTRKFNAFLDVEAQVTDDESVSDDEDERFIDTYEKSFVNDITQSFNTQIHGMYLRSIRSPAQLKPLQRRRPVVSIADVYSQAPPNENNEYLEDSFCVDASDDELTQQSQLSELDILEKQLNEKKRKKGSNTRPELNPKRRRIKCISSDDSE